MDFGPLNKRRIQFSVDPELYDIIDKYARYDGPPIGMFALAAVKEHIRRKESQRHILTEDELRHLSGGKTP